MFRTSVFCAVTLAAVVTPLPGQDKPAPAATTRNLKELISSPQGQNSITPYRKRWALVIGIDYDKADYKDSVAPPDEIQRLENAEKDAKNFYDLLIQHYGYTHDVDIKLLQGPRATRSNIMSMLSGGFLGDRTKVERNDSVLVFFAGHGYRMPDGAKDPGVLFPFDIRFNANKPDLATAISMHRDLYEFLEQSPARHKLLILDCCHSGEIFNREARNRNYTEDRTSSVLFRNDCFVAMASCLASQTANDGAVASNSPFTASLLQTLKGLPARQVGTVNPKPIPLTDIFHAVRRAMDTKLEQLPKLLPVGKADDDGEFYFFPTGSSGDYSKYVAKETEIDQLQALVPGEYGNWWFEETPWFFPGVRELILQGSEVERSLTKNIRAEILRDKAHEVQSKMAESSDKLMQMQARHLRLLLEPNGRDLKSLCKLIEEDLTAWEQKSGNPQLKPTDMHLLAVMQHHLNKKEARQAYRRALELYEREASDKPERYVLMAMCQADRGQYELEHAGDCKAAVDCFKEAARLAQKSLPGRVPAPFLVFVLTREASAWQRLNLWGKAMEQLNQAYSCAHDLDPTHELTAFVRRRRAWVFIEQWNIAAAREEFNESILILKKRPEATEDLDNFLAQCHDKHGLAMADRFSGKTRAAVAAYRKLSIELGEQIRSLRTKPREGVDSVQAISRLIERYVNTQERLIDCNLFSAINEADLADAVDDARRTLRITGRLAAHKRDGTRCGLLYRQALALALRSPVQDFELAEAICAEAKALEANVANLAILRFPSTLVPQLVEVLRHADHLDELDTRRDTLANLRTAIHTLRDQLTGDVHRDQLEWLMFAGKVLLDEGLEIDRHLMLQDAEDSLSFCRKALLSRAGDHLPYLRQYYERCFRVWSKLNPKQVKPLLEMQYEATTGRPFIKPERAQPTLGLFFLGDQGILIADFPGEPGKLWELPEAVEIADVRDAASRVGSPLRLPKSVQRELESLAARYRRRPQGTVDVVCRWGDVVHGIRSGNEDRNRKGKSWYLTALGPGAGSVSTHFYPPQEQMLPLAVGNLSALNLGISTWWTVLPVERRAAWPFDLPPMLHPIDE